MYNHKGNVYQSPYTNTEPHVHGENMTPIRIGKFNIQPMYLFVIVAIVVLVAAYLIVQFLSTHLVIHFGMVAGMLLLVANLREMLGKPYIFTQQANYIALLNALIGGALVCAWLSQIVSVLLWIPALVLIAGALPLVIGRNPVYLPYGELISRGIEQVKKKFGRF